jgi:hypothetical protein
MEIIPQSLERDDLFAFKTYRCTWTISYIAATHLYLQLEKSSSFTKQGLRL